MFGLFEDEIGRYNYEIDVHPPKPDIESYNEAMSAFENFRYGTGESYGIPYRTLIPKGMNNLLVAGRCVSTDRYMQGSLRVMPGSFITGQAAGMAACIASEMGCSTRDIDVKSLQQRLKRMGAFLPNC